MVSGKWFSFHDSPLTYNNGVTDDPQSPQRSLPMEIPRVTASRQRAAQPAITDVVGEVRRQWQQSSLPQRVRRGDRVAVAVGSRGIANLAGIVGATVETLRNLGTKPFIVAAMGSDAVPFRMNNLTACFLWRSKLPFSYPTDRACIETGMATCWQPDPKAVRMAVIPNTLELAELWISPPLVEEARQNAHLELRGAPKPLPFTEAGDLEQEKLFPHSVRARRCGSLSLNHLHPLSPGDPGEVSRGCSLTA
jgi:hypothetical protein